MSREGSTVRRFLLSSGKLAFVAAVNILVIEVLLRLTNLVYPLERPPQLADTYENEWLEGKDWRDGETRLYIYKANSSGMTYGHPFRVNRWGFRGHDFIERGQRAERDTYRIMVLGDSITAGIGVAEEGRYTSLLERMLQKQLPARRIEVINLGVHGFETVQEEKIMRRMWGTIQPDLTVVGFWRNDPGINYVLHLPFKIPMSESVRSIIKKSIAFRYVEKLYNWSYRKVQGLPPQGEEWRLAYDETSRDWKIFVRSVESIAHWVMEHTGHPPVVLNLDDVHAAKEEGIYQNVRDIFIRSGFIWSEMEEGKHYKPVSRFEGHPNADTHRAYAEALFRTIMDLNLIQSTKTVAVVGK